MNLTAIPYLNEQITFFKVESDGILVHPQKGKVRVLNHSGTFIWQLIDAKLSINDIIDRMDSVYACRPDTIQSEVIHFLQELSERSLIYLKEE